MAAERQASAIATSLGQHLHGVELPTLNQILIETATSGLSAKQRDFLDSQVIPHVIDAFPQSFREDRPFNQQLELAIMLVHTSLIFARYVDLQGAYSASGETDQHIAANLDQALSAFQSRPIQLRGGLSEAFYDIPARRRNRVGGQLSEITNATTLFAFAYLSKDDAIALVPAYNAAATQALALLAANDEQDIVRTDVSSYLQRAEIGTLSTRVREVLTQTPGISPDSLTNMLSLDLLSDLDLRKHMSIFAGNQAGILLSSAIDDMATRIGFSGRFLDSKKTPVKDMFEEIIRRTIYATILLSAAAQQDVRTIDAIRQIETVQPGVIPSRETIIDIVLPSESLATIENKELAQQAVSYAYKIAIMFLESRNDNGGSSGTDNGPGRRGGDGGQGPRKPQPAPFGPDRIVVEA